MGVNLIQRKLIIENKWGQPCEYSIWSGNSYYQSEVGGWAKLEFSPKRICEDLPHYKTFIITAGCYERVVSAICRENDNRLGCAIMK